MAKPHKPEALLVLGERAFQLGFDQKRLDRLRALARLGTPERATSFDAPGVRARLAEVEVLMTGWGAPRLDANVLAAAPRLRAVMHAAGSVKGITSDACWERGLIVTSAAEANAIPVAEYTLAAVLFAGKRVVESANLFRLHRTKDRRPEGARSNYQRTVGVIGYSRIGRRVVELLRPFDVDVLVADPFADAGAIEERGGHLLDLDDLLARCDIVSVHAPSLPSTRHMLDKDRLALIPGGGTIINTARGALIDTAALEAECVSGRLSAILDVTDPEPLPAESRLWDLPNVLVTPHVAGAQDAEVHRLVDTALDELERYVHGQPTLHRISTHELSRIA